MDNIELEIKIQITLDEYNHIKLFLKENGFFVDAVEEHDKYYAPSHRDFLSPEYPYEWLRIREKGDKITFNYKHFYPENAPVSDYCNEYEVSVSNSEILDKILSALNIMLLVRVDKKRERYMCYNEYEVSLDYIDELGYFVEIEYKGEIVDILACNDKVSRFAKELSLDLKRKDNRGYPYLVMEMLKKKQEPRDD
jgi:adenylate cyclase, class 2